ncbi:unnamed protein product [Mytilus coruscus]|uniref:B box-type domain-containing protein n=1 Tax=Mytilus coruscus TaxID=42192 RepID=A0A6J8AHJ3_MYTCO|nr:unnamed protein product [Mytilus coruscus]
MAQTPSKNCSFCNKLAALYCYDCVYVHHANKIFMTGWQSVGITMYCIYKPVPVCDSHKKEFLYYCGKCDCLTCKECMTSSHNGHITNEIKQIADIRRQDVDQIINKLKTKVEEIKKTLKTIDEDHSLHIQSDCDSYIENVEKNVDGGTSDH